MKPLRRGFEFITSNYFFMTVGFTSAISEVFVLFKKTEGKQ